jgi:hypothetical protein
VLNVTATVAPGLVNLCFTPAGIITMSPTSIVKRSEPISGSEYTLDQQKELLAFFVGFSMFSRRPTRVQPHHGRLASISSLQNLKPFCRSVDV